ncbi:MAG: NAD(P)/FAD-dependent oxidoreductase [Patescibacteria group bacterium]
MNIKYDIIVIGGAAAGLTAAVYAARRGLKTHIISKDLGGQAAITCEIENYPGVGAVEGPELMQRFLDDARKFGATFETDEVIGLEKRGDLFEVNTTQKKLSAKSVILAFGLTPRSLDIPGADKFLYKGLTYCAQYDVEEFKNKNIAIIGGGNSALTAAEVLAPHVREVYIVHRRDTLRAEKVLQDRVGELSNITYHLNSLPVEIQGDTRVQQLVIQTDKERVNLDVGGIVAAIGFGTKTKWLGDYVEYTDNGSIVSDKHNNTKTKGLFAAGDVTDLEYKQIIISAGDGAKAALSAYGYLQEQFGIKGTHIDWGFIKQ